MAFGREREMRNEMVMKKIQILLAVGLLIGGSTRALAQAFSSGSDGSYGPIDITVNTVLDVPPDGIFHATTITVGPNVTLSFNRNALNTPVYLLATGDVTLTGDIDVSGLSGNSVVGGLPGPGGFNGGNPGSVSTPAGDGYGPGGGKAGTGGTGNSDHHAGPGGHATVSSATSTNKGAAYGSALLIPVVGGSGGAGSFGTPGYGGGGGGGGLLIASDTRIDFTTTLADIRALGGNSLNSSWSNGGSGGAIRLIAPVVSGNGRLDVVGRNWGAAGRIRIDTLDRTALNLTFNPAGITSIGSLMTVFPTPVPRLDIIEAAGTVIPVGSGPVVFTLPFGSSTNRTVRVQARDFNDVVPIRVVLTPDNGSGISYDAEIDNQTANPAEVTVNVDLPVNVQVAIDAWTR